MNIEQIKAQVAEWEVWYKFSPPALEIIQVAKQLMAENEGLNTDIEILKTDVALHSDAHLQALRRVEELEAWQQNAVNVLNAYNKQPE